MPALIRTESSTGRSEDSPGHIDNNDLRFLEDHEYPALLFPGYSEKPLSEQLEPIAVIGMGTLNNPTSSLVKDTILRQLFDLNLS